MSFAVGSKLGGDKAVIHFRQLEAMTSHTSQCGPPQLSYSTVLYRSADGSLKPDGTLLGLNGGLPGLLHHMSLS